MASKLIPDESPSPALGQQTGHATEADKVAEARRIVAELSDCVGAMLTHEARFVLSMEEKFDRYGERTFVSRKVLFWLRDLLNQYS